MTSPPIPHILALYGDISLRPIVRSASVRTGYSQFEDRIRQLATNIELRRFPFPILSIHFVVEPDALDGACGTLRFQIESMLADRDDRKPRLVMFQSEIRISPDDLWGDLMKEAVARYLRQALHMFVAHEVDECFYVDGGRVFDPHAMRLVRI